MTDKALERARAEAEEIVFMSRRKSVGAVNLRDYVATVLEAYAAERVTAVMAGVTDMVNGMAPIKSEILDHYVAAKVAEAVAAEREACVADAGDIWGDGEQLAKRRAFRARGGEGEK